MESKTEKIGELVKALVKIQSKLPTLSKDEKGYGYNYTSLPSTIAATREILSEVGLTIVQLTSNEGDNPAIETILAHESGQYISSFASAPLVDMKGVNSAQAAGAVFSYLRRYGLQAILNLGSEDNDASSDGFKPKKAKVKPKTVEKSEFLDENTGLTKEEMNVSGDDDELF